MDKKFTLFLTKGILTYIPMLNNIRKKRDHTGGTESAEYCLRVFFNHIRSITQILGLKEMPLNLLEFGPGDSLGVGLAYLLLGGKRYIAIDSVEYSTPEINKKILSELLVIINSYTFFNQYQPPLSLVSKQSLKNHLSPDRISRILNSIDNNDGDFFLYISSPELNYNIIPNDTIDVIISQAVMEHIDNIEVIYKLSYAKLKNNGIMSHQIDHRCHTLSDWWNGHWQYSDRLWKLAAGRRPFTLNRLTSSEHISLIRATGFQILKIDRHIDKTGLPVLKFNHQFMNMSIADAQTDGTYILARKL